MGRWESSEILVKRQMFAICCPNHNTFTRLFVCAVVKGQNVIFQRKITKGMKKAAAVKNARGGFRGPYAHPTRLK